MITDKGAIQGKRVQALSGDSVFLLDLIRVLACEMVVVCHSIAIYLCYNGVALSFKNPAWKLQEMLGTTGVVLFFFVSGIVISNSLFKKGSSATYTFSDYFIDRFARIYSGLLPCLIFIYLAGYAIIAINHDYFDLINQVADHSSLSLGLLVLNLLMVQNFPVLQVNTPTFANVLWTLNIEWWLYMLFGWIVLSWNQIAGLKLKNLIILAIFGFYPIYTFIAGPENLIIVWFFGVLITALLHKSGNSDGTRQMTKALLYVTVAAAVVKTAWDFYIGVTFYDLTLELLIGLAILMAVFTYNGNKTGVSDKVKHIISVVAGYSFTLYLIHVVIVNITYAVIVTYDLPHPLAGILIIPFILSNVIAFIVAYFTERHYKKVAAWMKHKFASFKKAGLPVTTGVKADDGA